MIKLKDLISEGHGEEVDVDKLFWSPYYLEDVAEKFGYESDFSKVFWGQRHIPTLYHCTTTENYEQIKTDGLERRNERRGATSGNSSVGPAVFTTSVEEEVPFFKHYYGPVVIAVNAQQMKEDGFMPDVEQEPDWAKAKMIEFVLRNLGYPDDKSEAARFVGSSDQNTEGTVILYSNIPPRYLSLVEYD